METLSPVSFISNQSWVFQGSQSEWTREENKMFESALAIFGDNTPNRWAKVAAMIPGKSVYDVIKQYKDLEDDVSDIEAGRVPIPGYLAAVELDDFCFRKKPSQSPRPGSDHERKKGVPWTKDEHRRFLLGLMKYGKGDWRNISRNFVGTKTPTQVASHAQKYYLRQISRGKDKRRPSIHDFTTVNLTDNTPTENNAPFLDISTAIPPSQDGQRALLGWNIRNNEALVVLGSTYGVGHYAKAQASMFGVQSSRY